MNECVSCGAQFNVEFEEDETTLNFCPHCGEELVKDIEILEDYGSNSASVLYDSDDDSL